MISVELRHIAPLLENNTKIQNGLAFMKLIRDEGLLEVGTGYFPAILGGAVRDSLFDTDHDVQDIDIFIFRDPQSSVTVSNRLLAVNEVMEDFLNNLLSWLEDQDISYTSRLSDRAAEYFGGQRFLDILEFVWRDTTIQVMVPRSNQIAGTMDILLRQMPIYSGMALTLQYFISWNASFASQFLPRGVYPVATDRDLPYIRNKWPEGRVMTFRNSESLVNYTLAQQYSVTHTVSALPNNSATNLTENGVDQILNRAVGDHFGLESSQYRIGSGLGGAVHTL